MSGDINIKLQGLLQCLTESSSLSVSLDETSSNASCSTESQSKGPATRESYRTASQVGKSGTNGEDEASQVELSLLLGWYDRDCLCTRASERVTSLSPWARSGRMGRDHVWEDNFEFSASPKCSVEYSARRSQTAL